MGKITLTADQVVGKNLYAARQVKAYSLPSSKSDLFTVFEPGQLVGKVFSWVVRSGSVWWAFEVNYSSGNIVTPLFYIKHNAGDFSQQSLLSQFTPEQQQAIAEQAKIDLPNWLTFGGAGFAFYQASKTEDRSQKLLWQLGGALLGTYGITKVIEKIDFNPFDDLLASGD